MIIDVECPECGGEGTVEHPHLMGAYGGSHAESPPDPVMVDCEHCNGMGWRAMTEDEINDRAADAFSDMCEGEPPTSMDERHRAAWVQKQELRR